MNIEQTIRNLHTEADLAITNGSEEVIREAAKALEVLHRGFLALYRKGVGDGDSRDACAFFAEFPELEPRER